MSKRTSRVQFLRRLESFSDLTNTRIKISRISLAKANFQFDAKKDHAFCELCDSKITYFEDYVDPMHMHKKNCLYLEEFKNINNPIRKREKDPMVFLRKHYKKPNDLWLKNSKLIGSIEKTYDTFPEIPCAEYIKMILIRAKLFYTKVGTVVKCSECSFYGKNWTKESKPLNEHYNFNKDCPAIRHYFEDSNCPKFSLHILDELCPKIVENYIETNKTFMNFMELPTSIDDDLEDLNMIPDHPELCNFNKRKNTFNEFSNFIDELAASGFFYYGK